MDLDQCHYYRNFYRTVLQFLRAGAMYFKIKNDKVVNVKGAGLLGR
jgi:hypothetical protein